MAFTRVCSTHDVKKGHGKVVHANGHEIALFHLDDGFHAIDNACPHRRGPLGEGMVDDGEVTCPIHGWRFDIRSGKGVMMPVAVKKFPVMVEGENVLIDV